MSNQKAAGGRTSAAQKGQAVQQDAPTKPTEGARLNRLARVARLYHILEKSQTDIGKQEGIDQPTVARWLKEAHERNIVTYQIDARLGITGTANPELAATIRDTFDLLKCNVFEVDANDYLAIDTPEILPFEEPAPDKEGALHHRSDELLHLGLANCMATLLRRSIEPRDKILVAGGRAIHHLCHAIKQRRPAARDLTITPASGRIWTGSWQASGSEALERPLDADDACVELGTAFADQPGTRFSQIGVPLFHDSERVARQLTIDTCPALRGGGWNWKLETPNRAFLGIGSLDKRSSHRLVSFLEKSAKGEWDKDEQPFLQRAKPELEAAMRLVETHKLVPFCDIANRFFTALEFPSELNSREEADAKIAPYRELATILRQLNDKSIGVQWRHLKDIGSVLIIAGGELKARAVWTALVYGRLSKPRVVNEIAIDEKTAHTLVEEWKTLNAKPWVKEWYKVVMNEIGLFDDEKPIVKTIPDRSKTQRKQKTNKRP